jgi:ribosomal protein L3
MTLNTTSKTLTYACALNIYNLTIRKRYRAVQVAAGEKKSSKVNKAMAGHYAAANMTAGRGLWEFRLGDGEGEELKVGIEWIVRF